MNTVLTKLDASRFTEHPWMHAGPARRVPVEVPPAFVDYESLLDGANDAFSFWELLRLAGGAAITVCALAAAFYLTAGP